jgi:tripartite ATP-independent transporter DctM subunit
MNRPGLKFERTAAHFVSGLTRLVGLVGVVQLLVMMLLVVLDVVLRQLFSRPIMGSYELVQFSLLTLVYFALPESFTKSAHIRMTLVVSRLPEGARRSCELFTLLLSWGFFLLITWRNIAKAVLIGRSGGTSLLLGIPLAPFYLLLAFGCGLACLILAGQIWRVLRAAARSAALIKLLAGGLLGPALASLAVLALWRGCAGAGLPAFALGLASVLLLLLFLAAGLPIAFSMGIVGLIGFCCLGGPRAGLSQLEMVPFGVGSEYILSVVPLFLLMGQFSYTSGLSRDLYDASYAWLGHLPGGLAMATVVGCAAFAAISGSSIATAVTIGAVALPAMRRYRYSSTLALGSIAAGGTIGILIPPSIVFILYGILTEQSIGKLFMAGLLPGVLSVVLYMLIIAAQVRLNPGLGPPGARATSRERLRSLKRTWGMLVLFVVVLGGIYLGFFTPTEAGAVGACGAFLMAAAKKKITRSSLWTCLLETGRTTATLVIIFVGAMLFNYFLALTNLPLELAALITEHSINRYTTLFAILAVYLLLGSIMDPGSMIILTIPIFFPIIRSLGFDPIWFGVLVVVLAEIGCITPPVGINVFAVKSVEPDVSLATVFRGVLPFWAADILRLALLVLFPQISLFLPSLLGR